MKIPDRPLVSILIPLYNQVKYFPACIKSVCRQTYTNLEIIVVNDGSTDCSPQLAYDWAAYDSRVRVIDKENEGLAFARRDGYLAATGEYVFFLDSDDKLPPRAIELLMNAIQKSRADIVMGLYDYLAGIITTHRKVDRACPFPFSHLVTQPELFENYYENFFSTRNLFPVMACGKFYRKEVIDRAYANTELYSPDVQFMGEDLYFNMKLFPYVNSMYRIDESVYKYRYGGGTFGYNKNLPQILSICDKQLDLLDQFSYERGYGPLFGFYVSYVYNHAAQLIYFNKADKQGVIDFFINEIDTRYLMPYLEDYFSKKTNIAKGIRLMLDRDFEGMYYHASERAQEEYGSLNFKAVKFVIKFFELLT